MSTKEQDEKKLEEYREKWREIALNCDPLNFEAAKAAAIAAYGAAKLSPPKFFFHSRSPVECAWMAAFLKVAKGDHYDKAVSKFKSMTKSGELNLSSSEVVDYDYSLMYTKNFKSWAGKPATKSKAKADPEARLPASTDAPAGTSEIYSFVDDITKQVYDDKTGPMVGAFRSLMQQVRGRDPNRAEAVFDSLCMKEMEKEAREQVRSCVSDQVYGSHDGGWLAYYDYMSAEKNDEQSKRLLPLCDLAKVCGWWAPYSDVCIFQDRHLEIHLNADRNLHNESGPAVRYADGFEVYAINGIRLDRQIVMAPETQTIKQIEDERNGDVRTIRVDRFGWGRYIKESASTLIDFRDNDVEVTKEALYRCPDKSVRLVATCPSGKIAVMGVPPTIKTCIEAKNWLAGSDDSRVLFRT